MASAKPKDTVVPDEETKKRIFATIYGQCAGDALGLLTEFLEKKEAKTYYKSVSKSLEYSHKAIVNDMHRMRWAIGDWTDDSDQMILILQTIMDGEGKREIDYKEFAMKLKSWQEKGLPELGDTAGMGIGRTTLSVLHNASYKTDPHKAATLIWEHSKRQAAPNGGVMRTSVVGVHYFWDLDAVIENAINCVKITHADPRCQASAVAVSTTIARMLQRDPAYLNKKGNKYNVQKLIDSAYESASTCLSTKEEKDELKGFLECHNIKALKLDEGGKIGYTYKSMGTGFWALKQDDFRKAITKIVMEGGDADSNACVGGAMLACKLGISAIPETWKEKLKHKAWLDGLVNRYFSIMGWNAEENT